MKILVILFSLLLLIPITVFAQEISDNDDNSFAEELPNGCPDMNFIEKENVNYWTREVKDDQMVNAVLPGDPCDFRTFQFIMKEKYQDKKDDDPIHHWYTGVVLHRIGNINTIEGTFDAEFYYWVEIFDPDDPANFLEKPPTLYFINMVGEPKLIERTRGFSQTEHYYDITVSGKFRADMDYELFPFEKLNLNIIVEPSYDVDSKTGIGYHNSTSSTIQSHVWPYYGLLSPDIPIPGYKIQSYEFSTYDYRIDLGNDYSRYEAKYIVEREFLDVYLKFIFPMLIMTGLALMTHLLPSQNYFQKIELSAVYLLGIVFFVQGFFSTYPITEATIFDHIMLSSLVIIVVIIATNSMKWKYLREFQAFEQNIIEWEKEDTMNHDLNIENLRRAKEDIEFFEDKLEGGKDEKRNQIAHIIESLKDMKRNLDKLEKVDSMISSLAKKIAKIPDEDMTEHKNLSPEEIREKIDKFVLGREQYYQEDEPEKIKQIIKELEKYEEIANTIKTRLRPSFMLRTQKHILDRVWKLYGEIIIKEEKIAAQRVGTWQDFEGLEKKREEIIQHLKLIQDITKVDNVELVFNENRALDVKTIKIISKNKQTALKELHKSNYRMNRIALITIMAVTIVPAIMIKINFI